ncbi:MAG: helix-turn-helix domain-containing protein [Candidatus Omnitrophica bacterium]|nr:helix-turn-helix domain-containing protein [Candidatus Omnitrophota bacterium]
MVSVLEKPEVKEVWPVVGHGLVIRTEKDYDRAVALLHRLVDEVGENTKHPLYDFVDVLSTLVESYEDEHIHIPEASPRDMLKFFMDQHDLKQSDLPEIGTQSVVSEILSGKRELNTRQIKALSKRFGVSPAVLF